MSSKIFGYIRVSTPEQNIERQKYDLSKFVKNEDNIFIDKQSGRDFNRPAYKELKLKVRDGDDLYVHSIDRFGRNKTMISEELEWFRKNGIHVHILDIPQTLLEPKDDQQREILEMATNIVIEVLSYVAQKEREMTKKRQAEGIAVWRRTGQTKTGRPYGRPKCEILPKNWEKAYRCYGKRRTSSL